MCDEGEAQRTNRDSIERDRQVGEDSIDKALNYDDRQTARQVLAERTWRPVQPEEDRAVDLDEDRT